MEPIYLDYAAATPVSDRVFRAMQPYFQEKFYNPSSAYSLGRQARADFDEAKARLARVIGAKPGEIIITSGATESVNLALLGVRAAFPGKSIAVSAGEHQAVLQTAKAGEHTIIAVDSKARVHTDAVKGAVTEDTVLISIGYVQSELGTVQSLADIGRLVHEITQDRLSRGNRLPLYLHTDASQAAGVLDLSIARLGVDLMTLSAAKIYGPKQSGLLYIKAGTKLSPTLFGGGQELGLRSGTEQTALTAGFAEALDYAHEHRTHYHKTMQQLRDRFEKRISEAIPTTIIQGDLKHRAAHISYLGWDGVDAERLLFALDEVQVYVSTGAACAANKGTIAPVLEAIKLDSKLAAGSIRCSFGKALTEDLIDQAADRIIQVVLHLLAHKERLL